MVVAIIGLVGALIVAYISYRLGERSAWKKEERAAQEEDLDLQLYAEIVKGTKDGSLFHPEIGSDTFKRVLRLQQRGLLERLPDNSFCLPGAPIRVDTSKKGKA